MVLAAIGLKGFLIPNGFIDGGVTGVSMLVSETTHFPLYYVIFAINLPFILLGYTQIRKQVALKGFVAIVGLSLCLALLPIVPITLDKLLAAVFGGMLLGAGIGLTLRGGGVLDGTEILAILLDKKWQISVGDAILAFNVVIFSLSAWLLGLEAALYSVLTYMAASKTIDFLVYGLEEHLGIFIISSKGPVIKELVLKQMGRGATILDGKRGFSGEAQEILYCVITRFEVAKLKLIVERVDPTAFVTMHKITHTVGGMVKKGPLH